MQIACMSTTMLTFEWGAHINNTTMNITALAKHTQGSASPAAMSAVFLDSCAQSCLSLHKVMWQAEEVVRLPGSLRTHNLLDGCLSFEGRIREADSPLQWLANCQATATPGLACVHLSFSACSSRCHAAPCCL